jgi:hypothetical protein
MLGKQEMNRRTKRIVSALTVLMVAILTAHGTSYYFPKFGTPIVAEEHLVFSGPGWEPHRIICISRETAKKTWQIEDEEALLQPWFVMAGDVVITKGADIYSCNVKSGKIEPLYSTGYERCGLSAHDLPLVLIGGEKENVDLLSLVDLRRAKKRWEVQNLRHIVAQGNGVLLCQYSERKVNASGSYSLINQKLIAISELDGRALWTYSQPRECRGVQGVAIGDYFVIGLAGTLHCLNQKTGAAVKTHKIHDGPYASVSLAVRDDSLLAWTQEGHDLFSGHVVFSVSVPDLVQSELTKTDWYSAVSYTYGDIVIGRTVGRIDTYNVKTGEKLWQGGQWNWEGVHDGWIYFSTMETNRTHASVNRIEVTTGRREKLYEEHLPYEWRRQQGFMDLVRESPLIVAATLEVTWPDREERGQFIVDRTTSYLRVLKVYKDALPDRTVEVGDQIATRDQPFQEWLSTNDTPSGSNGVWFLSPSKAAYFHIHYDSPSFDSASSNGMSELIREIQIQKESAASR